MSAADQAQVVAEMDDRLEAAIDAGSDETTQQQLAQAAATERRNFVAFSDEDRFALLEPKVPLVLLPVRLETAFMFNAHVLEQLRVRVYPDTIHLDGFDPNLSTNEIALGKAYHTRLAEQPAQREALDSWLARILGPGRAKWVRDRSQTAVTPENHEEPNERPTRVWTLPDQWRLRLVWGDQSIQLPFSHAVRRPLIVGPSAQDKETLGDASLLDRLWNGNAGGSSRGEGMLWMLDFEQAQLAGMALDIDLTSNNEPLLKALQTHLVNGGVIDEITVSGVQSALSNTASAKALSRLFTAHSIDRDLTIPAQGSATNNDARRPTLAASVKRESGANVDRLRKALGLSTEAAPAFADTDLDEDQAAGAMARCLWRATLGDFLERQIGMEDNELLEELRQFFCRSVRARGPFSALQIDREPYGVLPIIPPAQYSPINADPLADSVRQLLDNQIEELLPKARAQVSSRPAPQTAAQDRRLAFLETLSQEAHPGLVAGWLMGNRASFSGDVPSGLFESNPAFARLHAELDGTPLSETVLFDGRPIPVAPEVPFVRYRDSLPENKRTTWTEQDLMLDENGLSFDELLLRPGRVRYPVRLYRECPEVLELGAGETLAQFADGDFERSPADPLLFTFLRHGLLLTFEKIAHALLNHAGISEHRPFIDDGTQSQRTFPLIDQLIDEVLGGDANSLRLPLPNALAVNLPATLRVEVEEFVKSLPVIGKIGRENSDALELLFREHLGLISYRLDAWHTAFATQRLEDLRANKSGSHIGGYGRVQMLRLGDETPIGEFIPAPSLGHATTAAVLRSGFTHRAAEMQSARANAVDLSSSRVRGARDLLDGIRQGRTLATVLGHRFERLLREEGLTPQNYTRIVNKARKDHPGAAGKATNHEADHAAEVAAGNELVDGLSLLRKYEEVGHGPSGNIAEAETNVLARLADEIDAVSDLTLAESVHQIVNGRSERAAASLDVIGRGDSPPERFEVVETPRTGTALTVRVLVVETPPALPQVSATPQREDVRKAARVAAGTLATMLDRWLGSISDYGAWLELTVRSPAGNSSRREWISLDAIDLDWVMLYLGMPASGVTVDGVLHRRIESAAQEWGEFAEADSSLSIDAQSSGPNGEPALDITQALLTSAQRTLGEARPLTVQELLDLADREGERPSVDESPSEQITELNERAALASWLFAHAVAALRGAAGELAAVVPDAVAPARIEPIDFSLLPLPTGQSAPASTSSLLDLEEINALIAAWSTTTSTDASTIASLRMAMRDLASIGFADAEPAADATTEQLLRQAHALNKSFVERIQLASVAIDAKAQLQALFGRHLNVLPVHKAALGVSLSDALSQSDALLSGEPELATRWAYDVGAVRQCVQPLLQTLQLAETLRDQTLLRFQVGQHPNTNTGAWAALEGRTGMPARLAIAALDGAVETLAGEHFSGFVIDEWVETIPSTDENAALALQASSPTSRAPQCVLLAMTGHPDERWSPQALDHSLDWAFDLAAIRGLKPEDLGPLKDVVPAMVFGQYR